MFISFSFTGLLTLASFNNQKSKSSFISTLPAIKMAKYIKRRFCRRKDEGDWREDLTNILLFKQLFSYGFRNYIFQIYVVQIEGHKGG